MSPVISRLAAAALLVGVAMLALFGLMLPAIDHARALEAEAETLELQIARFARELNETAGTAPVELAEPALLEATNTTMASVGLQDRVERLVDEAGGRMRSLRVEAAAPLGELLRLPLTAELSIGMAGLEALLHAIEIERPYVLVEGLEVTRGRQRRGADAPPEVSVRVRLAALMRSAESP